MNFLYNTFGYNTTEQDNMTPAKDFINFLNKSPSAFHAVEEVKIRLAAAGFSELNEGDQWNVKPLGKYFVTKNSSCLIAFAVGGMYVPGQGGFSIIGTHTDSPCPKVKPISKITNQGFLQVGVHLYGGGIWSTWFDRDLKVAGRVIVKKNNLLEQKLLHIDKPIMRIPTLAIHLARDQGTKFEFNKENHIVPVLGTLTGLGLDNNKNQNDGLIHHSCFLEMMGKELQCNPKDILDFELDLVDHNPATLGGLKEEFVFGGRLDNLHSTYTALMGFMGSMESLKEDTNIRMISMFDNEEVGSTSAQGANSAFQIHTLKRLCSSTDNKLSFEESMGRSFLISSDMAHAIHPNYSDKHEGNHRVQLHKGPVLKYNANQRYATNSISSSIIKMIANEAKVPVQEYVNRNDIMAGSTIGPLISSRLGILTVDIGAPQLSMHSIREMCCSSSLFQGIHLFKAFYDLFPKYQEILKQL